MMTIKNSNDNDDAARPSGGGYNNFLSSSFTMLNDENSEAFERSSSAGLSTSGWSDIQPNYNDRASFHYARPNVAAKENRRVLYAKIVLVVVLLAAVVGMAVGSYQLVSDQEERDFQTQFENMASEVIAVSREHVTNTFGTIQQFSETVSSYAIDTGAQWPNVTIPHYPARANKLLELTSMDFASLTLLLSTPQDRLAFEEYARSRIHPVVQQVLDYDGFNMSTYDLDFDLPSVVSAPNRSFDMVKEKVVVTGVVDETKPPPYLVNWNRYPYKPKQFYSVLWNGWGNPSVRSAFVTGNLTGVASISFATTSKGLRSQIIQPIFDNIDHGNIVGMIWVYGDFTTYFQNLVNTPGDLDVVMKSSCGEDFAITYRLNGLDAELVGVDDHHDPKYDDMEVAGDLFLPQYNRNKELPGGVCVDDLTLHIYPTDELKDVYTTNEPLIYAFVVVAIFVFASIVFVVYDWMVGARQHKVMERVVREDKILGDIFPEHIRDRMYHEDDTSQSFSLSSPSSSMTPKKHVELFQNDVENPKIFQSAPLADLYLNSTVVFADIAGFTAWSSAREPAQVFLLLETIYAAFDKIANVYGVYKVETVGDCYVACAGVPEPCADHVWIMARFALSCLRKMKALTPKLEVTLGPDTGELQLRVGIHSGQITAGVLRGERARFQLFGDTVNTAARVESTGKPGMIHISDVTADLLKKMGKGKWLTPRQDQIHMSGKGDMQTYWLAKGRSNSNSNNNNNGHNNISMMSIGEEGSMSENHMDNSVPDSARMSKLERLVEYNTDILCQLLCQILACRTSSSSTTTAPTSKLEQKIGTGQTVLEEFQEIITLPKYSVQELQQRKDANSIDLSPVVVDQVRSYVGQVAMLYQASNSFHNFDHASHVASSVRKLLTRIVKYDGNTSGGIGLVDCTGHSYGITSDPLVQFAAVFSAIIHDAGHPGVPNAQLVVENSPWNALYKGKSLAEQNSVDTCWQKLMQPAFKDFRDAIYSNEEELKHFRQLVVNITLATDIADKELQALRKNRWNVAFSERALDNSPCAENDRKATIVLEHLIQASDVSHTMQHWKIYLQWNEKFFFECYKAYKEGRATTDPSIGWYKGEIGFFNFYIIPLAKKLETCGVFGVSSDEYLNYATANLSEWERKGESVVAGFLKKYDEQHQQGETFENEPVIMDEIEI